MSLLDFVVENTQTSELGQFHLTSDTIENLPFRCLEDSLLRYQGLYDAEALRKLRCYLPVITAVRRTVVLTTKENELQVFSQSTYAQLMVTLQDVWQFMFGTSPTRYISRNVSQIESLIQQKRMLQEETE